MRAENEKCELSAAVTALALRVDKVESRLETIESASSLTRQSVAEVNANIETLSRMIANMDKRLVEEKEKWGSVLREIVKWTARALLLTAAAAAGVNLAMPFFNK